MTRAIVSIAVLCAACASAAPRPAALDPGHDACAHCRMIVSDPRLAAQIAASGEEPRFFDDLACLAAYLDRAAAVEDQAIHVADHRTGAWVPAAAAVYTRIAVTQTPMASGLLAHADDGSRAADPAAAGGERVAAATVLPRLGSGRGSR